MKDISLLLPSCPWLFSLTFKLLSGAVEASVVRVEQRGVGNVLHLGNKGKGQLLPLARHLHLLPKRLLVARHSTRPKGEGRTAVVRIVSYI